MDEVNWLLYWFRVSFHCTLSSVSINYHTLDNGKLNFHPSSVPRRPRNTFPRLITLLLRVRTKIKIDRHTGSITHTESEGETVDRRDGERTPNIIDSPHYREVILEPPRHDVPRTPVGPEWREVKDFYSESRVGLRHSVSSVHVSGRGVGPPRTGTDHIRGREDLVSPRVVLWSSSRETLVSI